MVNQSHCEIRASLAGRFQYDVQAAVVAVGDFDNFGGDRAKTLVYDRVDTGEGQRIVVGVAETETGFGPGIGEQVPQRATGVVNRRRVD